MPMTSPWDNPPEETPDTGVKGWSYLGILGYFGLTMLATFGALFLLILFVILTTAFSEWTRRASSDTSNPDGNEGRAPIEYNFNIPENAEVHFHNSPTGQIRQVVVRPILNHRNRMTQDESRLRHPVDAIRSTSASMMEIPSTRSMEIQRSVRTQLQEPRRCISESVDMGSLRRPLDQRVNSSEQAVIQGGNSYSTNSAHTNRRIRTPTPNKGNNGCASGSNCSDDDE